METEIPYNQYNKLIPQLNAKRSFNVFEKEKTALTVEELPFFNNYDLIVAQTFSTIPPVKFNYLWNSKNNDIIALDGTRATVFDNLQILDIVLNNETIVPYVKFVLDCVLTEHGSLRLVEKVEDIEFSDHPTVEETAFLQQNIRPTTILEKETNFEIDCIIIFGTEVYRANIVLQKNGIFDIVSEIKLKAKMNCLRVIMLT